MDAVDALVASQPDEPPRPNLMLPTDYDPQQTHDLMECREESKNGRGWFARTNIAAGTVLLVSKPIVMVMNWQAADDKHEEDMDFEEGNHSEEEEEEEQDSKANELLLLQLLRDIRDKPSLWTDVLSDLYPRDSDTASKLPKWVCQDDGVFLEVEKLLGELRQAPELREDVQDIAERLHLVIRYNVLSIETCPELLVHPGPGGHSSLDGSGLYHLPSFFNHDSQPNASRYAVGDVMWFVANQEIFAGDEICISYLEHDVLCESPDRRTSMLQMDFHEPGTAHDGDHHEDDEGPDFPVVDDLVQNELMGMDPIGRLDAIQELLQQAMGKAPTPEDEEGEEMIDDEQGEGGPPWFQCDVQNLGILRAITLDGLGRADEALGQWEECVKFAETMLPPLDESSVVMRVQAALCARCAGNRVTAKHHAAVAMQTHSILFGGGTARFRRRFFREVQLSLRPDSEDVQAGGFEALDDLWPVEA